VCGDAEKRRRGAQGMKKAAPVTNRCSLLRFSYALLRRL
jgi:hypothetical protein